MSVFVAEGKKNTLLSDIMTCASCLADSSLHTDPPWAVSAYTAWACGEKQLGLRQVKAGGAFQVHQNEPPANPSMTKCQHCYINSHYSQVMGLIHEKESEWSCNSFIKSNQLLNAIKSVISLPLLASNGTAVWLRNLTGLNIIPWCQFEADSLITPKKVHNLNMWITFDNRIYIFFLYILILFLVYHVILIFILG